eukprot:gene6629-6857_t
MAKLGLQPSTQLGELLLWQGQRRLWQMDLQLVASLAWGAAKLQLKPRRFWLHRLCKRVSALQVSGRGLTPGLACSLLLSLSALRHCPRVWMARFLAALQPQLPAFSPQDFANSFTAFGRMLYSPGQEWMFDYVMEARLALPKCGRQQLLPMLHAQAVLSTNTTFRVSPDFLAAQLARCRAVIGSFSAGDCVNLGQSLVHLKVAPGVGLLAGLAGRFSNLMLAGQVSGTEVATMLWVLGGFWNCNAECLWLRQNPDLLRQLVEGSRQVLGSYRPMELKRVLVALASMGCNPGQAWLAAHETSLVAQLQHVYGPTLEQLEEQSSLPPQDPSVEWPPGHLITYSGWKPPEVHNWKDEVVDVHVSPFNEVLAFAELIVATEPKPDTQVDATATPQHITAKVVEGQEGDEEELLLLLSWTLGDDPNDVHEHFYGPDKRCDHPHPKQLADLHQVLIWLVPHWLPDSLDAPCWATLASATAPASATTAGAGTEDGQELGSDEQEQGHEDNEEEDKDDEHEGGSDAAAAAAVGFDAAELYSAVKPRGAEPMLQQQPPQLLPQLRPYQRRAAHWMLSKEGVRQQQQQQQGNGLDESELRHDSSAGGMVASPQLHPLWRCGLLLPRCPLPLPATAESSACDGSGAADEGILADEMGLGKTVELLALIMAHRFQNPTLKAGGDGDFESAGGGSNGSSVDGAVGGTRRGGSRRRAAGGSWAGAAGAGAVQNRRRTSSTQNTTPTRNKAAAQGSGSRHCSGAGGGAAVGSYAAAADGGGPGGEGGVMCSSCLREAALQTIDDEVGTTLIVVPTNILVQVSFQPGDDAGSERNFRRKKRYAVVPTPLSRLKFWRLVVDEAQQVAGSTARAADMACRVKATHRWAVTGRGQLLRLLHPAAGGLLWRNSKAD